MKKVHVEVVIGTEVTKLKSDIPEDLESTNAQIFVEGIRYGLMACGLEIVSENVDADADADSPYLSTVGVHEVPDGE